jgi:hypothetical protein
MTTEQELQIFAQHLELFCKFHNLKFACLKAEHDLEPAPRWALAPYLYLTHVSEELVCGHIIATAEGRNLFIRVRTPFAASSTLKFVTLRTYSLILLRRRQLNLARFARDLSLAPVSTDLQQILTRATDAAIQAQDDVFDFIQPEHAAPLPTKDTELVACRATFCSGTVVGNVLPSSSSAQKADAQPSTPAELYLL